MRVTHQIETLSHHKKKIIKLFASIQIEKNSWKARRKENVQNSTAKGATDSMWIGTDAEPSPSVHRMIVKPSISIFWTV